MTSRYSAMGRTRAILLNAGAFSLFLSSLSGAVRAQESARQHGHVHSARKIESALCTVLFKTPQGQIRVLLPADMRPGDAIIGSAALEPKGRQDADKDANRAQLGAYTLSLAGQSHPTQDPTLPWNLPADLKAEAVVLILADAAQREAAHVDLSLTEADSSSAAHARAAIDTIGLPKKGQAGRPLAINPPAGGGIDDLHVVIGDKEAHILAASPRVYVVESPRDVLGKTKLQVKRGSETVAEGDFRNNRVSSGNPWPYVIAAVVITGIVVAISIANDVHHAASGIGSGFGGFGF